ncbi:unannotated protein [freshwater metagenome]|uniref:Unannotated protein n=1 Tax=freshwater metagenome TaxID=449393 RepID=A0A6J6Y9Z1_9ZZZZ
MFSNSQDRQRIGHALGGQCGAIDGVNSDINFGSFTGAHALPVEQHGGFVLFAFTNDDDAVHGH